VAGESNRRFVSTTIEVEGREETKVVEMPDRELEPWGADRVFSVVGCPVPRVDGAEKASGAAEYTVDRYAAGMLYAALVRSSIPRGRSRSIDLDAALKMPGVVDAISFDDLPKSGKPIRAGGVRMFDPDVTYAGQPIACICADSPEAARAAADSVRVGYDPLPFAASAARAVAGDAPPVRLKGGNVSRSSPDVCSRGDVERGLAGSEVVVRGRYTTPSVLHTAMEPHGALAEWHGDQLTIHEGTQGVFAVRDEVAAALGIPRSRVRVVMEHMGGGFGAKNHAGAHTISAALLARRTRRPVRCVLDRVGEQLDTGHRPSATIDVTLGARKDGTLTAIVAESLVDQGISGWESATLKIFHELYLCPNVKTTETFAYTNTQAMAAFRGPGHTEGCFALERAMDELAIELGIDPLELRLRNHADSDQEKSRPYSSGSVGPCLKEAARRFGWINRARGPEVGSGSVPREGGSGSDPRRIRTSGNQGDARGKALTPATPGRFKRGFGLAARVWPAGGGPPAYASVRIHPDGSVDVLTGTQDLGTGARTIFAQVAAEALGASLADVRVILGDTERTPFTPNSWGSMTTPSVAPAVRMAAEEARERLIEAASEILGVPIADIDVRDGRIRPADGESVAISDITSQLGDVTITGNGSRGPNPRGVGFMTFGAQFAEVEVDTWTGNVRVLRITAVHDVGRVLNPLLARSQLEGGIIQGLGYALFEERVVDERLGLPLNAGLHDYKIPTMADIPEIDASFLPTVDTVANPVGARGLAEPPIIPTAPAIANAVRDALGVPVNDLPLTPWRVLLEDDAH
jgi:xanthine dehydrogenase YagR molybdenum-binding subunit